jgi:hypothetical protein
MWTCSGEQTRTLFAERRSFESGIEELQRRLEVLLGAKAHAAIDESEKQRQQQEAERLARRSRVAEAGG